jgi:acid phosphatase family membrane protein YuiD
MESGFAALIAFVAGWVAAQVAKVACEWTRTGSLKKGLRQSLRSGGMPSGHTASFVAMTIYFLLAGGVNEIFALSFATMGIIVYDAVNVRKSVGEISEHINTRIGKGELSGDKLRVVRGHTILEVIFGAILGVVIGVVVYFLTERVCMRV